MTYTRLQQMSAVNLEEAMLNHGTSTESALCGHNSMDAGVAVRPKSAWKNSFRKPQFTSVNSEHDLELDLEILELDDDANSPEAPSSDSVDLSLCKAVEHARRTSFTNNRHRFRTSDNIGEKIIAPSWINKSSPRAPRAWQEGSERPEFRRQNRVLVNHGKSNDMTSTSEYETDSSTGISDPSKCRNDPRTKVSRFLANYGSAGSAPLEDHLGAGGIMVERYRPGDSIDVANDTSLSLLTKGSDVVHRNRLSIAREATRLTYSNMRQKLDPIETSASNDTTKHQGPAQVPEILTRRRHRLKPLLRRKVRELIYGSGLEDNSSAQIVSSDSDGNTTHPENSAFSKTPALGATVLTDLNEQLLVEAIDEQPSTGESISTIVRHRLSTETSSFPTPTSTDEAVNRTFRRRGFTNQHILQNQTLGGESSEISVRNATDATTTTTALTNATTATRSIFAAVGNGSDHSIDEGFGESQTTASNGEAKFRRALRDFGFHKNNSDDIRPKYVSTEFFRSSTAVTRSSSDVLSYPLLSNVVSGPLPIFYATDYSHFLPNDVNLEEFSLFGEFTKSFRPSSPSDELLDAGDQPSALGNDRQLGSAETAPSNVRASEAISASYEERCISQSPYVRDESSPHDVMNSRLRHLPSLYDVIDQPNSTPPVAAESQMEESRRLSRERSVLSQSIPRTSLIAGHLQTSTETSSAASGDSLPSTFTRSEVQQMATKSVLPAETSFEQYMADDERAVTSASAAFTALADDQPEADHPSSSSLPESSLKFVSNELTPDDWMSSSMTLRTSRIEPQTLTSTVLTPLDRVRLSAARIVPASPLLAPEAISGLSHPPSVPPKTKINLLQSLSEDTVTLRQVASSMTQVSTKTLSTAPSGKSSPRKWSTSWFASPLALAMTPSSSPTGNPSTPKTIPSIKTRILPTSSSSTLNKTPSSPSKDSSTPRMAPTRPTVAQTTPRMVPTPPTTPRMAPTPPTVAQVTPRMVPTPPTTPRMVPTPSTVAQTTPRMVPTTLTVAPITPRMVPASSSTVAPTTLRMVPMPPTVAQTTPRRVPTPSTVAPTTPRMVPTPPTVASTAPTMVPNSSPLATSAFCKAPSSHSGEKLPSTIISASPTEITTAPRWTHSCIMVPTPPPKSQQH